MAFLGAWWRISDRAALVVLGFSLIAAGVALALPAPAGDAESPEPRARVGHLVPGAATGLLSGMAGIGGGIFLAPILYWTRWGGAKYIAAASSAFILFNSLAGLAGQFVRNQSLPLAFAVPLMLAVLVGGQLGSRWAIRRSHGAMLRRITGLLVAYAGINVLMNV